MVLNYKQAHKFVRKARNARWEGWNIVLFISNPRGFMHKNGRFNRETGTWGFERVVSPNSKGLWVISNGRTV